MPGLLPSIDSVVNAAANVWDMTPLGSGLADRTPTPTHVIDEGPQRNVHRYRPTRRTRWHAPVLLVPPLAAPATCFDLWRGSSLAGHLLALGYPTYLVDYGPIAFSDRQLGIEHWVDDVIPNAVRAVSEDSDGLPVQLVGWCLGGIMSTLAVAGNDLPVRSVAMVASPFDFEKVRTMAPIRRLAELTGGRLVTGLYSALGGAPAPLVSLGFQVTALDKRITKPLFTLRHLGDRDLLAHVDAVDEYMAHMLAYPGRTFAQLYHRFFRINDLADGRIELSDRTIDIADLRQPVLVVAGKNDVLAPAEAVVAVEPLLTGAASVRVELMPGGHLGVLTGRGARESTWRVLDEFLGANDVERAVVAEANRRAAERHAHPWRPEVADADVDVVRAIHAAWAKRESPRQLIAKDLEYVNPPYAVESGTRHGRKFLGAVLEVYPDFHLEPERYVDTGDEVLVLGTATGTGASGVKIEWKQGFLWTVEDGRATRLRWFNAWDEALEAAGLDA